MPNTGSACIGPFAGYAVDFAALGVAVRGSACASSLESSALSADVLAYDLETRLYRAWDLAPGVAALAGLGGGVSLFRQSFESRGVAPDRQSAIPFVALSAGASVELGLGGLYAQLDCAGETHFLRLRDRPREVQRTAVTFAVRGSLALGKRF